MKLTNYRNLAAALALAGVCPFSAAADTAIPDVAPAASADSVVTAVVTTVVTVDDVSSDSTVTEKTGNRQKDVPDPFMSQGALGHFTWGVDIGSGVDLTSHDMTGFCMSACVGYKGHWMRFAGVGLEVMSMMNNSSRLCPIYAMARTSFSPARRQCFLEARAGVSVNSIMPYRTQTDFYGALGVGFTLAHSRKFSSHVVLRGTVIPMKGVDYEGGRALNYVLAYACIGLGCAF